MPTFSRKPRATSRALSLSGEPSAFIFTFSTIFDPIAVRPSGSSQSSNVGKLQGNCKETQVTAGKLKGNCRETTGARMETAGKLQGKKKETAGKLRETAGTCREAQAHRKGILHLGARETMLKKHPPPCFCPYCETRMPHLGARERVPKKQREKLQGNCMETAGQQKETGGKLLGN